MYPIVDVAYLRGRSLGDVLAALAAGGARLAQLRAKRTGDRELHALALAAREACRRSGLGLVINDRPDVAHMLDVDGVHVGQEDLPPVEARRVVGDRALVGLSTHNEDELQAGVRQPVDYLAFGPIFATTTKEGADPPVGLGGLRRARQAVSGPLVAIGGITRRNAAEVVAAGADGVAVISDLMDAGHLEQATRELVRALEGTG